MFVIGDLQIHIFGKQKMSVKHIFNFKIFHVNLFLNLAFLGIKVSLSTHINYGFKHTDA